MPEKELRKKVIGKNGLSNLLLALKIVCDLIPQILLVYLISSLITNNISEDNLKYIFLGIFISFALKGVFYYFATRVAHEKAYEKLTELRLDIIGHLKKLSLGFFKEHNTGELTNIVQHDVEQVEVYLAHGLPEIMSVTLLPTIIFVAMIFVDWRLALGMIAGVPLMYLVKVLSQKTMDKNFAIYFNHENKMREELMEYVKNISVIKAFAKEEEISERTLKTAREYIYWVKKSMGAITIPMGLIDIFMEIGVVIVMILGSIFLYYGEITTPNFILAIILSSAFTASISKTATLQHFSIVFREALNAIGKVLTVPLPNKKTEQDLEFGNIEFKDVNFAYGKDGFELKNINLTFKKNSLNAFVGASGCGKSTVSNLLMEQHYMYYVSAVDSYERLSRILYADVISDKVNGIVPKDNDIAFENIDFSYEKDEFKMEKLSFSIAEKRVTALVGESGSGKTTITNLLLRFYDVHKGKITLGGVDIRDIPYDELLDRISIVMQNVQLFDNTIEENIKVLQASMR